MLHQQQEESQRVIAILNNKLHQNPAAVVLLRGAAVKVFTVCGARSPALLLSYTTNTAKDSNKVADASNP